MVALSTAVCRGSLESVGSIEIEAVSWPGVSTVFTHVISCSFEIATSENVRM